MAQYFFVITNLINFYTAIKAFIIFQLKTYQEKNQNKCELMPIKWITISVPMPKKSAT